MKTAKLLIPVVAVMLLVAAPRSSVAQDDAEPPTIHYITTSTFTVPYGEARGPVISWIDEVSVPLARLNDELVSFRVAVHNYGADGGEVVFISEYASWEAIAATCEPCNEAFEEMQPEEGTPEREVWDANLEAFLRAYQGHSDEIYNVNMDTRAK